MKFLTPKNIITNVYEKPSHSSQLISQIILNEPVQVIKSFKDWKKIKSSIDGYEGWIYKPELSNANYKINNNIRFTTELITTKIGNKYFKLPAMFPIFNYIEEKSKIKITIGLETIKIPKENTFLQLSKVNTKTLSSIKKYLLGVPYLWGGKTTFGIDCSGLTQLIALSFGKKIPRDSYQQALIGKKIPFEKIKVGDFAFFHKSGKINHVGIISQVSRKKNFVKILHSSSIVKEDILTPSGIIDITNKTFSLTHKLIFIKRII